NGSTYKEWSYIVSPSGVAAAWFNNNGTGQLLYMTSDHAGSPYALTNTNSQVVEQYSFDAWGRRRNTQNWNNYTTNIGHNYMIRGFNMHEELDEIGVINMNGRLYDPVLGRFLQPDNYVESPDVLQTFNRYAYCLNNPL